MIHLAAARDCYSAWLQCMVWAIIDRSYTYNFSLGRVTTLVDDIMYLLTAFSYIYLGSKQFYVNPQSALYLLYKRAS